LRLGLTLRIDDSTDDRDHRGGPGVVVAPVEQERGGDEDDGQGDRYGEPSAL
jgi:hypothetical protein